MNNNLPLVSVIAVCYNHEKYLVETLDSIINQTYKKIEIVILDDNSNDNSVELIENWITKNKTKCDFIKHQYNQGICSSLNESLSFCSGDYIQLISCDDKLVINKIEIQVNKYKQLPKEYGIVYSDAFIIDELSKNTKKKFLDKHLKAKNIQKLSGNIFNELIKGNFIPAMSTLIKKEVFLKVGKYDEELDFEDYDFWLRASKFYKFYYIDDQLVYYRLHENNLHKKINAQMKWLKNNILIGIKHLDNNTLLKITQQRIIDFFFINNDRSVINKFYKTVNIDRLENKLTHMFIKFNLPAFCIKIGIRIDQFIKFK